MFSIQGDTDVVVLTSGILTITTLLPLVPVSIGHWLQHLFEIFSRLSAFRAHRSGTKHVLISERLAVYLLRIELLLYVVHCHTLNRTATFLKCNACKLHLQYYT